MHEGERTACAGVWGLRSQTQWQRVVTWPRVVASQVWRYYLLVNRPETADTDFRWDDLAAKNNSELLNNLGNFVNRTLSYCAARLGGRVPAPSPKAAAVVAEMSQKGEGRWARLACATWRGGFILTRRGAQDARRQQSTSHLVII